MVDPSDSIHIGAWNRARAEHGYVGTCRSCGGYLAPDSVDHAGKIDWYTATCVQCHHVVAAPDARVLRGSSRHAEMPAGWWQRRTGQEVI